MDLQGQGPERGLVRARRSGGKPREPASDAGAARLQRRTLLKLGLAGGAAAAGVGSVTHLLRSASTEAPAEVFKGDAPQGELWAAWQQRGWVREGKHYYALGKNVQCHVCPNECLLAPEDRSRCRNKVNKDGKLYTLAYGNPCTLHVDPIEKKPLFHFLPGTPIFSLATAGCSLRCLNCQNWEISQKKPEELKVAEGEAVELGAARTGRLSREDLEKLSLFPDDVVALARATESRSVAYTYAEPTSFYEYMLECARAVREAGLKNVWVTNGYINRAALEELAQVIDGANVDLKAFSEEMYQKLNGGKLEPVLKTLEILRAAAVWFEVTALLVPTYTDDRDSIRRMCDWLVTHVGADTPVHFSRFRPEYKLEHLPPTPLRTLVEAREAARQAGLRYVYVGNAREIEGGETTVCPGCKEPIIERLGFEVQGMRVADGRCAQCKQSIAGIWS